MGYYADSEKIKQTAKNLNMQTDKNSGRMYDNHNYGLGVNISSDGKKVSNGNSSWFDATPSNVAKAFAKAKNHK